MFKHAFFALTLAILLGLSSAAESVALRDLAGCKPGSDDPIVTKERFQSFRDAFGDRFEAIELEDEEAAPAPGFGPHSVLTLNLRDGDPDSMTRQSERRVIAFFKARTGA